MNQVEEFLKADMSVDKFMIVGRALLIEITGRPIAVFDDAEKWVECRKSRTETTRLEDWVPGNDAFRYYCLACFKPDEFGWILAISFAKLLNDVNEQ